MKYLPMMAESAKTPFDDPGWLFEAKWDGIRAISDVGQSLSIRSRNDRELSQNFPELSELMELSSGVVLDGEIVVMRGSAPSFQDVAKRVQASNPRDIVAESKNLPATYVVFDILEAGGRSVTSRPLHERKALLRKSVVDGHNIVVSSYVVGSGVAYYQAAVEKGLEGVVAKRLDSPYRPGVRSADWLKVKKTNSADCIVVGYTPGEGARSGTFGAFLLGLYDDDKLVYVGKVGTGFSDGDLRELLSVFKPLVTEERQAAGADIPRHVTWLKPELVAEIVYQNLTDDGRLRAPRFIRLRNDKAPRECTITQVRPLTLEEYKAKRNFSNSPEPAGKGAKTKGNSYVVQEHHASHLHWDLRLEKDGVLKSWAVPKGPPEKPGERRLAIQVEDHPLDYGGFEGIIPEGEYGAGTVKIWDKGTFTPLEWNEDKIEVVIEGERLKGPYELVRFKRAGDKQWLLFKKKG